MGSFVAVYDACVLYPAQLRDLLPRVAHTDLFKARWSVQIQDEWINALLRTRPELKARLQRTRELIDQSVPDCLVQGYEAHIEGLELPDAHDRHVLTVAIQCQASVVVTANLKDFPKATLKPLGITAQHPDEFLTHVFNLNPGAVINAVREMRAWLINSTFFI
jgi:predicted nucleic acid-binding protein